MKPDDDKIDCSDTIDGVLLTLTTTHRPATDLGYLLVKHPDRVQSFDLPAGTAHVFYPEADEERCTAALLLEVDPLGWAAVAVAGQAQAATPDDFTLGQYVNDRPYAASSLLAVGAGQGVPLGAARRVAGPARAGRHRDPAGAAGAGAALPGRRRPGRAGLRPAGLDGDGRPRSRSTTRYPEWGDSRYVDLTLTGTLRLADALNHLYVLLPVLDDAKHYWVAPDEVDKLLRAGAGWLADHPERGADHPPLPGAPAGLASEALARLAELRARRRAGRPADDSSRADEDADAGEDAAARRRWPCGAARRCWPRCGTGGATRVLDLGCGGGALLAALVARPAVHRDRRRRRVQPRAGHGRPPAAAGPAAGAAARPDPAVAVGADLPRRPAARLRRGGADGGHRARRPAPAAGAGGRRVRPRPARHGAS